MNSSIEWTDKTWQVTAGCSRVSEGCRHCYAEVMAGRLAAMAVADERKGLNPGKKKGYQLVVRQRDGTGLEGYGPRSGWNHHVELLHDRLREPFGWKKPARIFVNSESDLFHPDVPFDFVDKVFAVMALCPQHTFQVLTKRPERMAEYFLDSRDLLGLKVDERLAWNTLGLDTRVLLDGGDGWGWHGTSPSHQDVSRFAKPLPNVWLGTSVEDQKAADERIPHLLKCPAAVRFLSCEPLLAPVELSKDVGGTLWMGGQRGCGATHHGAGTLECPRAPHHHHDNRCRPGIDWVIAGGESGGGARPMHPDWARSLRDQCQAAGVPFFFKQWGEWLGSREHGKCSFEFSGKVDDYKLEKVPHFHEWPDGWVSGRFGRKLACRLLDGKEHNDMPGRAATPESERVA